MRIFPNKNSSYREHKLKPQTTRVLNFEARTRVDKGLQRFYEANQNRMPVTLEKYISGLKDMNGISPMDALKKAFEVQLKGLGFGFVEILSSCPTNWKMTPEQAHQRVREEMIPVFPLGVFKDITLEVK